MPDKKQRTLSLLILLFLYAPFLVQNGLRLVDQPAQDFPSYYFAARLAFDHALSPYTHQNWLLAGEISNQFVWPFLYPPPTLVLFRLLNLVSYTTAKNLFLIFNHGLLLAFFWIMIFKIQRLRLGHPLVLLGAAYLVIFRPLSDTLRFGQVNLLILVLITAAWWLLKEGRSELLAGLALALAALIKVYPALLIGLLLLKGRWRAFALSLFWLVLLSAASLPFLPQNAWVDWLTQVSSPGYGSWVRGLDPAMLANQSLNGFTARLFLGRGEMLPPLFESPLLARLLPLLGAGLVGLASLAALLPSWRHPLRKAVPDCQITDEEISLFLLVMVLAAPISWEHQFVFILPPVLLAFQRALDGAELQPWRVILLAVLALALAVPELPRPQEPLLGLQGLLVSVRFFALLGLWGFSLFELVAARQKAALGQPHPAASLAGE